MGSKALSCTDIACSFSVPPQRSRVDALEGRDFALFMAGSLVVDITDEKTRARGRKRLAKSQALVSARDSLERVFYPQTDWLIPSSLSMNIH